MSRSHRKSLRPDPTVAPIVRNPLHGNRVEARAPFTPSAYQTRKAALASAARRLNRNFGHRVHGVSARGIDAEQLIGDVEERS